MAAGTERRGFSGSLAPLQGVRGSPWLLGSCKGRAAPGGTTSQELWGSAAQHRQGKALVAGVKGKALTAMQPA